MPDVVVANAARTAHGALLGSLADVSATDLGATALAGLAERIVLDPDRLDWVAMGNAVQAGVGQVPARQAAMGAGYPEDLPATTINEASGSGLRAITLAIDRIEAGRTEAAVAGGMESMSQAPYLVPDMRRGRRHGDATLVDAMINDSLWDQMVDAHMGEITERLADRFDISREAQDAYAAESNRRAAESIESGAFAEEIVPVETGDGVIDQDEGPRADTTVESLGELPGAFRDDGTITAGNASKLSDGAGAALLTTQTVADDAGMDPLARVVDYGVAYRDPEWFGMSVGDVVERLLDRNDLAVDDVDHYELNEAFAAQMVYARDRLDLPEDRHNPLGGAVALGHPIGASGGILTVTIAHAMAEHDHDYGVVGMSVAGGGAIAMLLGR